MTTKRKVFLMKKMIMALVLTAAMTSSLFAQGTVKAEKKKYTGWISRECAVQDQLAVRNDVNFYGLNFVQYLPDKKGQTDFVIHLSEPRQKSGFGRLSNSFFHLDVNGISIHKLQPQPGYLNIWNKDGVSGGTSVLNFDGAKVEIDAYMREKSPMLWFTIRQPEKQVEPVKTIRLSLTMIISDYKKNEKGVIWSGAYHRQAQTASRKLEQQKGKIELTAEDRYLILSDAELDGSSTDKGCGPVYLTFSMDGVQKAALGLGNGWLSRVEFDLKPDFKEFRFGILRTSNSISNDAFQKMFEADKPAYLLK